MAVRATYVIDDDVVVAQFKEPVLIFEVSESTLTKGASRKMGKPMKLDWYNLNDEGLITSIDFVEETQ